jgi:hypothetical protein
MDKKEFWATKNPGAQFETIAFSHSAFSLTIRLVRNQFADVTLGGNVYTPAPMTIKPPDQSPDAQPKLTLSFPRQVVGRTFKQQLALIVAAGSREPIVVTYGSWLAETDAPKVSWVLYASEKGGVSFGAESVQVTASLDNPMRRAVGPVYDPAVFTGLETL